MSNRTISPYTSDVNSFLRQNARDTGSAKLGSITAIQAKDVEDYLLGLARSGLNFPSVRRASFALVGKFQQIPFTPTKFASQNLVGAVPTRTYLKNALRD